MGLYTMIAMPAIDPVAFSIGPIHVHWYGIMYLVGFLLAFMLAQWRVRHYQLKWTQEEISDLIFFAAVGVIVGGRLGYVFFYDAHKLLESPLSIFKLWEGGMSFHGGLIGVIVALFILTYKIHKPFLVVTDFTAPLVPLGLAAGRIGNFINGELWGRVTNVSWGMIFPRSDLQIRHPSQLYEFCLEGVLLFFVVFFYASKPRPAGNVSGIFLIGYAICRLIAECFREPDVQLGFLAFNWLTMGQLLSIPMLIGGFILLWINRHADVSKSY